MAGPKNKSHPTQTVSNKDITQDIQGFDKKALPYIEMYDFLKTLIA